MSTSNATNPRTEAEIEAEIDALKTLRDKVPPVTAFGDDNRAAIDAEIDVLVNRMTMAQVLDRYEGYDDDENIHILSAVLNARAWLWNEDDHLIPRNKGKKSPPTSEGWANLVAGNVA